MKDIPGTSKPYHYSSNHPIPLLAYAASEIADMVIYQGDKMVINQGDKMVINKIITDDLLNAVTIPIIQQAIKQDK